MTRNSFAMVASTLLLIGAIAVAGPSPEQNIPPGVSPEMWHPLSANLGIAIQVQRPPTRPGTFGTPDSISGALMVRQGDKWRVVNLSPGPSGLVPSAVVSARPVPRPRS
jgi:hypothetical protein